MSGRAEDMERERRQMAEGDSYQVGGARGEKGRCIWRTMRERNEGRERQGNEELEGNNGPF